MIITPVSFQTNLERFLCHKFPLQVLQNILNCRTAYLRLPYAFLTSGDTLSDKAFVFCEVCPRIVPCHQTCTFFNRRTFFLFHNTGVVSCQRRCPWTVFRSPLASWSRLSMRVLNCPCLVPLELVIQQLVQWILNPFDWCDGMEVREGIRVTVYFPIAQVLHQSCDNGSLSVQQMWVLPKVDGFIKYM